MALAVKNTSVAALGKHNCLFQKAFEGDWRPDRTPPFPHTRAPRCYAGA